MDYEDIRGMFDNTDDIPEDILKMMANDLVQKEVDPVIQKLLNITHANGGVFSSTGGVSINNVDYNYSIISALIPSEGYISIGGNDE